MLLHRHALANVRLLGGIAGSQQGPFSLILLDQHRVTHAGAAALEAGVRPGMTRRAARAACPEALVLEADREQETALFELVAAAVDTIAAGVDVLRPGVLLMSARGPARHQGGEERLAERILDAVADQEQPEVSQQELTDHILFTAQSYGMDPNQFVAQLQQSGQIANLFSDVRRGKALAIAISRTQVADEAGNPVDPNEYFGEIEEDADDVEGGDTAEAVESDEN